MQFMIQQSTGIKPLWFSPLPRTGKTVLMADIARRATAKGNRVLFIVHRREILEQAENTFKSDEDRKSVV